MKKTIIESGKAPAPIGPYSQAVKVGNTLYASGQIAINPENGELVTSGVENETKQVMKNIEAVLEAAEMTFANVVKSTIFLASMGDFAQVNSIYGTYFPENPPARETVAAAGLPKGVNVEISITAID